jgi:hypothetical protein
MTEADRKTERCSSPGGGARHAILRPPIGTDQFSYDAVFGGVSTGLTPIVRA